MFFQVIAAIFRQFVSGDAEEMHMVKSQKLQDETHDSAQNCIALDVTYLNQTTFGDLALRTEILGLFRAQVKAVRTQLLLPVDQKAWVYLTHTLKGAAAAVGAQQLAALADTWGSVVPPKTQTTRLACEAQLSLAMARFNRIADQLNA
jgi:HPt (histidine-containing phosphotransfer) domain-containing protein